jgi:pimeloyl-ACP methyl ester carboxylesterase
MAFAISKDGTRIGYSVAGAGPVVVFVDGALCYRGAGPSGTQAEALKDEFTVVTYDRRGRGESGNTLPYALERELEDLEAVIDAVGGSAMLMGVSSGGVISLDTADRSGRVTKVFSYEAPLMLDGSRVLDPGYAPRMYALIEKGDTGGAVKHFLRNGVGAPAFIVFIMQFTPMWKSLKAIGATLAHDTAITVPMQQSKPLPPGKWSRVTQPVLSVGGSKSPSWMRNAQRAIAEALPNGRHDELIGGDHMAKAELITPMVKAFFRG